MDDLFEDLTEGLDTAEPEERKRARQPYKEAGVRPASKAEAAASTEGILDLDSALEKTPLAQLYVTQAEVRRIAGSNGLRSISTFSGCGGSETGYAWGGWKGIAAVEFVGAARETIALNYDAHVVEPTDVLAAAREVAEEMNREFGHTAEVEERTAADDDSSDAEAAAIRRETQAAVERERRIVIVPFKQKKVQGEVYPPTLDWPTTLAALDTLGVGDRFMARVTERALAKVRHLSGMPIWGDDIRGMDAGVMLAHLGLAPGELDSLEGSPPCKSFSTSGLREDGWEKIGHYSEERVQRTDDLFDQYVRLLREWRPRSFIAENVVGMTMGEAERRYMAPLMEEFRSLGYRVEAVMLDASEYGVPQKRPRVFFQGIRNDQRRSSGRPAMPSWPSPSAVGYTCRDALELAAEYDNPEDMAAVFVDQYEIGKTWRALPVGAAPQTKTYQLTRCHPDRPVPTITATSAGNLASAGPMHPHECRKFTPAEYRILSGFPVDYALSGSVGQRSERIGRSVMPYLMKQISEAIAATLRDSHSDGSMAELLGDLAVAG